VGTFLCEIGGSEREGEKKKRKKRGEKKKGRERMRKGERETWCQSVCTITIHIVNTATVNKGKYF